tara:strand:+ start:246 stop:1142 length:897 start_codon:yes stop_codon:yes gene_type:complete
MAFRSAFTSAFTAAFRPAYGRAGGSVPFFDVAPNAAAGYSLRDLVSLSGDTTVVRVRRSSDNAEADFKANEVSTIAAWVGAGNDGFVSVWYDQTGTTINNMFQSSLASQPKIVLNGTYLEEVDFLNGTNTYLQTTNSNLANLPALSIFSVLEGVVASINEFAASAGSIVNSTGNYGGWAIWANGYTNSLGLATQARYSGNNTVARATITSAHTVYSATLNGTAGQASANGVLGSPITNMITPNNTDGTRRRLRLGCQYTFTPASFYSGAMKEFILYTSDQSANRTALEDNMNKAYNLY